MFKIISTKKHKSFLISASLIIFSLIFIVIFFTVTAVNGYHTFIEVNSENNKNTVIIDAGHGAPDGGAVGVDGVVEKDINLSISLKLESFFEAAGYKVIMTRSDDNAIYDKSSKTIRDKKVSDIHNRFKIITSHPNALFISIHQNIYSVSKYSGTQVFFSPNSESSNLLAQSIQNAVKEEIQPDNSREVKKAGDNLYLLYNAKSTAVMVECGFLSNPEECKKLEDDNYQKQMAFAIFYGVLNYNSD